MPSQGVLVSKAPNYDEQFTNVEHAEHDVVLTLYDVVCCTPERAMNDKLAVSISRGMIEAMRSDTVRVVGVDYLHKLL